MVMRMPRSFWAPLLRNREGRAGGQIVGSRGKLCSGRGRGQTRSWREELWGDPGGATSGRTHSRALSSFTASSTSMILEPARSCMTRPEVTIGLIPSSMHVPRFEAIITRAQ